MNWVDKMIKKEKNESRIMRIAITLTLTVAMFILLSVAFLIATPEMAYARSATPTPIDLRNPLAAQNLQEFLEMVIGFLFRLGLILAPVFILIAAFYFMTAAGNPAQIETGKRIIIYTVIGLIVIIMARGAVEFIQRMF